MMSVGAVFAMNAGGLLLNFVFRQSLNIFSEETC